MDENSQKAFDSLAKLLPDIYKDLAQPGVQPLGKAIGNVIRFCTLPFSALGTIDDMVEANLAHNLNEYKKKLEKIPKEKIMEVPPQLGVPVLQKLSYTTNEEIAKLFINLLTTASNMDTANKAHPGFETMVSQLSPDEARIIQFLSNQSEIYYCDLRGYPTNGKGFHYLLERSTMIPFRVELDFENNIDAYLSNLVRLGILEDKEGMYKTDSGQYIEIQKAYKYERFNQYVPHVYNRLEIRKSYFDITSFGRLFINACTNY